MDILLAIPSIKDFLAAALATSKEEFEKLMQFPYAHLYDASLVSRLQHCCCPTLSHLTRGLSPKVIMDTAKSFDTAIDKTLLDTSR